METLNQHNRHVEENKHTTLCVRGKHITSHIIGETRRELKIYKPNTLRVLR